MTSGNLVRTIAISCLLVGAQTGAAMAAGCGDGLLWNETFDSLRITDDNCSVIGCTVRGDIVVINVDHILLMNNKVGGEIRVDGNAGFGTANVIANSVFGGRIVVREHEEANVIENETLSAAAGNIEVNDNARALVQKNISSKNLVCLSNTDLDSFINFAVGTERCPGGRDKKR